MLVFTRNAAGELVGEENHGGKNELRGGGRGNKTFFSDKFIDEVKMKMAFNEI
ncbi:hypothetical protein ACI49Z_004495 [Cronobacter turicensis]|uniref:hypothetical protein n=1 Tax=Cronobacter turicensis TaxID=413502 RepID=UPI0024AE85DF|nr:hypothetical protein [Cronobacter turicensis]ELQ6077424.1 hypothetical protein [Cronobacter turicensis]ELQ6239227.1 hypothetical protein [Cronobacter turicensis]ELQ6260121.1 hypothetical protein [Cronobacter turicensis]MDI6434126.1 hypothetical protein [Cronobacter turicensis]